MINPIDGTLLVYAENPNRRQKLNNGNVKTESKSESEKLVDRQMTGVTMWGELFKYINKLPVGAEKRRGFIIFPPPSQPQKNDVCVELQAIDLKVDKNSNNNSVGQGRNFYVSSNPPVQVQLKSGQKAEFDFYFYRELDLNKDYVNIALEKGDDRSTRFNVEIDGLKSNKKKVFSSSGKPIQGRLLTKEDEKLTMELQIPVKFAEKSVWKIKMITSYKNNGNESECEYDIDGIYID